MKRCERRPCVAARLKHRVDHTSVEDLGPPSRAPDAHHWVKSIPALIETAPSLTEAAQALVDTTPTLVDSAPMLAEASGRSYADLYRNRPNLVRCRPPFVPEAAQHVFRNHPESWPDPILGRNWD